MAGIERAAGFASGARTGVAERMERWAAWVERYAAAFVVLFALIYLLAVAVQIREKPLWHDELFTYYIAQAPTLRELFEQIRTLDLNPPLSYLLVRMVFKTVHVSAAMCRVPSVLGFLMAMVCSYGLLRRRMGALWGLASLLALVVGSHLFAIEARPYGLLLGFIGLALLGWDLAASARGRWVGVLMLMAGLTGALLSHVFALPVAMLLLGAEVLGWFYRRRVDWAVLVAMVVPFASVLLYAPMMRAHASGMFPASFQPGVHELMDFYAGLLIRVELVAVPIVALAFLLLGKRAFVPAKQWPLAMEETVALVAMLAFPAVLIGFLKMTHGAFFARYGFMAHYAAAVLVTVVLGWWAGERRTVGLIAVVFLGLGTFHLTEQAAGVLRPAFWRAGEPMRAACAVCAAAEKIGPGLPLVDASGLTFVEMDHRVDAGFLQRVYYLTDKQASTEYAHANIFEGMELERQKFKMLANVAAYPGFIADHRRFLVFGSYEYPEDWLLRKLKADNARLELVGFEDRDGYKDKQLWMVTLP